MEIYTVDAPGDPQLAELLACIASTFEVPAARREAAFRSLYDQTSTRLFGVAMRVLRNRAWAEDVLQDAYLNIWRIAGTYRGSLAPPLAWMALVVRSRALDFLRKRHSEKLDHAEPFDDTMRDTTPSPAEGPLDLAQASEHARVLHDCLRRLDASQREVLGLAYLRDLSHGELAAMLKLPLGTVKTRIRRALIELRGCMGQLA